MIPVSPFSALLVVALAVQTPSTPPSNGGGQQPGTRPPGTSAPRTDRPQQPGIADTSSRIIFISGKVLLADGTPPPASAAVERVCNGVVRPEGYTDAKGNFSFQLGGQSGMFYEASIGFETLSADPSLGSVTDRRGVSERELVGCEIRANLAGFISDVVPLGFRRSLDDPDIGIIHLRPLERVQGLTFSATTAAAPREARKAYEDGVNNIKKRKWADAERDLTKAVRTYPAYAIAWYDLGRVYQQQQKLDEALRAYEQSIEADEKFLGPYGQLALLAIGAQKWDDVIQHTSDLLRMNPYVTPDIYFYSAIAHYNLREYDIAEDHAQRAARLDVQHQIPRINHLLGVMLLESGDGAAAAENFRIYLKFSPNAPDAAAVREQLAILEK